MRRSLAAATAACTLLFTACDDRTPADPSVQLALSAAPSNPTPLNGFELRVIGRFAGGGPGAAEITAYDDVSRRLFVVNGARGDVDVLDLRDPTNPRRIGTIVPGLGAVNSVSARKGLVALAIQAPEKTQPGTVAFHDALTLDKVSEVAVGALPDMLTFSPTGRTVVVANEGEPNDAYTIDPEGSVSIIDVSNRNRPSVRTATFTRFIGQEAALRAQGIRIYGPNANAAQDLEPEYVAISDDERTAYVTLQENNAIATVDLATAMVTSIAPLGYKDHRLAANRFDPSDRDDGVNIRNWPVLGMYQPDAVAAYTVGGQTYLVTANEGDARDWAGFAEEVRVGANAVVLNPSIFTEAACNGLPCKNNAALGRLTITSALGRDANGRYDALYVLGGRSFSVWSTAGGSIAQVFDSGDQLEQFAATTPYFNFNHEENGIDNRSDNKGPEPEGVTVARLGAKAFAFVVLERSGGIVAYDVTTPSAPTFVTSINTRGPASEARPSGDLGPEGIEFIPAARSPNRRPLLVVGHEISGTTVIYEIVIR